MWVVRQTEGRLVSGKPNTRFRGKGSVRRERPGRGAKGHRLYAGTLKPWRGCHGSVAVVWFIVLETPLQADRQIAGDKSKRKLLLSC